MNQSIYEFTVDNIQGNPVSLADYKGKVLLIVNTASNCGFTPQFKGLEEMYKELGNDKFSILGFPCNQFLNQDPGANSEIQKFCEVNYGVSFPMFGKIDVNGKNAHPLYHHLKAEAPGFLGSKGIKWNFTKFLVDHEGNVIKRFSTKTKPVEIINEVKAAIAKIDA